MAYFSRVMFMTPPEIGKSYPFGERTCTVIREEEYTRARDGEPGKLLIWETTCAGCGDRLEFKTGTTAGDMVSRCPACRRVATEAEADRMRRERTVETPAPPDMVWRALRALLDEEGPLPMSLARNTSRATLYAPALLRRSAPEMLDPYTLAEIHQGIENAIRQGWIGWQAAGRYGSGHVRRGLFARPADFLRRAGILVDRPPQTPATEAAPQGVFA